MDVLGFLISRLFPTAMFASVYGWVYGAFMVGTSIGPPAFGMLYERLGDYAVVLWCAASMVGTAGIALAFIGSPKTTIRGGLENG
jgi:MFS family permease